MDELFYKDLLEKAIVASNVNPNDIDTKGFFKWNFFSVEEWICKKKGCPYFGQPHFIKNLIY